MANDPIPTLAQAAPLDDPSWLAGTVVAFCADVALPRAGRLPVAKLQSVLDHLGVAAEVSDAALTQLRQQGVLTRKGGHYVFDLKGVEVASKLLDRLYAPVQALPAQHWVLALGPVPEGAEVLTLQGTAWIARETRVTPLPPGVVAVRGALAAPVDIRPHLLPAHNAVVEGFGQRFDPASLTPLTGLDAMVARFLLIAAWRDVVSHYPDIPRALTPPDWAGHDLRSRLIACYQVLLDPSEAWVTAGPDPAAPASAALRQRFGGVLVPDDLAS